MRKKRKRPPSQNISVTQTWITEYTLGKYHSTGSSSCQLSTTLYTTSLSNSNNIQYATRSSLCLSSTPPRLFKVKKELELQAFGNTELIRRLAPTQQGQDGWSNSYSRGFPPKFISRIRGGYGNPFGFGGPIPIQGTAVVTKTSTPIMVKHFSFYKSLLTFNLLEN